MTRTMTLPARFARFALPLALAALANPAFSAEEAFALNLKARAGSLYGSVVDATQGRRTVGFGLEAVVPAGKGRFTAEVTYDFFNSNRLETTQFNGTVYMAGNQDTSAPTGVTTTYNGHPLKLVPGGYNPDGTTIPGSLQAEQNQFKGVGLRLGYRAPLAGLPDWNWQAGITLDNRTTHHEVFMTLVPVWQDPADHNWKGVPPDGYQDANYYEGALASTEKRKLQFGLYGGLSREFFDMFPVEVNLRYTNFSVRKFNAFTNTGVLAHVSESNKPGLVLEVSVGWKL